MAEIEERSIRSTKNLINYPVKCMKLQRYKKVTILTIYGIKIIYYNYLTTTNQPFSFNK